MSASSNLPRTTLAVIANEIIHTNKAITQLTEELRNQRLAHETRMEKFENKVEASLATKADTDSVKRLEDINKWVGRTVGGIVIAVVLTTAGISVSRSNPAPSAVHQTLK